MSDDHLPELISFLETLAEPHILCDRQYRIVAANAAYRARSGGADELIGQTCYAVSHRYPVPCDQAGESCPLARSLKSGQRERVLMRVRVRIFLRLSINVSPLRPYRLI